MQNFRQLYFLILVPALVLFPPTRPFLTCLSLPLFFSIFSFPPAYTRQSLSSKDLLPTYLSLEVHFSLSLPSSSFQLIFSPTASVSLFPFRLSPLPLPLGVHADLYIRILFPSGMRNNMTYITYKAEGITEFNVINLALETITRITKAVPLHQ